MSGSSGLSREMKQSRAVVVLDTHAILAYLLDQRGAEATGARLTEAQHGDCRATVSAISLCEICYIVERRKGAEAVAAVLGALEDLPIEVIDVDRRAVLGAARVKAAHAISLGDAFVVALALDQAATILTGDGEFRRVAHLVPMQWSTENSADRAGP